MPADAGQTGSGGTTALAGYLGQNGACFGQLLPWRGFKALFGGHRGKHFRNTLPSLVSGITAKMLGLAVVGLEILSAGNKYSNLDLRPVHASND